MYDYLHEYMMILMNDYQHEYMMILMYDYLHEYVVILMCMITVLNLFDIPCAFGIFILKNRFFPT